MSATTPSRWKQRCDTTRAALALADHHLAMAKTLNDHDQAAPAGLESLILAVSALRDAVVVLEERVSTEEIVTAE